MSILTSASRTSVSRGYGYYKEDKVNKINQLNEHEYEGYVIGSIKEPYYVKIDVKHPKKSYCDCPHANGNIICKHMTALYFELFPEEVDDYESWLNNDYEDEYDDEEYYDDYGYNSYSRFEKPLFFDEVLNEYVNSLNVQQLRHLLLVELKNDEKRTYELYLQKNYNKYLKQNNEFFIFLEKLNKKVNSLIDLKNSDYKKCLALFDEINNAIKINI